MAKKATAYYRSEAYSTDDTRLMYEKNPSFRRYANQAAVVLAGSPKSVARQEQNPEGLNTAIAAANASTQIGNYYAKPKFPHPALVLSWVIALGENAEAINSGFKQVNEATDAKSLTILPDDPGVLLALVQGFKIPAGPSGQPGRMQAQWGRALNAMQSAANSNLPYWFKEDVTPMAAPTRGGSFQGNRLLSITVLVPTGANVKKADRVPSDKADSYAVPSRVSAVKLDLTNGLIAEMYGQIWLCASKDRKSLFLATERSHRLKFEEFLKLLSSGTGAGWGMSVLTQLPMKKSEMKRFKSTQPKALSEKIQAAERARLQNPYATDPSSFVTTDN